MKLRRVSVILLVVLTGCAGPSYMKAGASDETAEEELAACQLEAMKATASAPGGTIAYAYQANTLANDIAVGMRQGEITSACMRMKGYRLRP